MAVNKVQFGNQTIMDITDTSTTSEDVVEGQVFYNAAGVRSVGTLTDATTATHGLMSAEDKSKLDGIDDNVTHIIQDTALRGIDDYILFFPENRRNVFAFLPASQIIILKTTDGGTTWEDAGVSDITKEKLFSSYDDTIQLPQINNETTPNCGFKIYITNNICEIPEGTSEEDKLSYWLSANDNVERSCYLTLFHIKCLDSSNSISSIAPSSFTIKYYEYSNSTWKTFRDTYSDAGSDIYIGRHEFKSCRYRTIFEITIFSSGTKTSKRRFNGIAGYGSLISYTTIPMVKLNHLYSYDYQQNAFFPNKITATDFIGKVSSTTLTVINTASFQNDIYVNCDSNFQNGVKVATEPYVTSAVASAVANAVASGGAPMVGATTAANGVTGLVPAPTTADLGNFLSADGTWRSGGKPMVVLSYGSSTWDDFINAYNDHVIVYCKASSNSNPASGNQTRQAFMAYVNSDPPTEVEFQYYRSVSSHSSSQLGDQVFIYKLSKTNGWSVTTREASMKEFKVESGSNMSVTWSSNKLTLQGTALPAVTTADNGKILMVVDGAWAVVTPS